MQPPGYRRCGQYMSSANGLDWKGRQYTGSVQAGILACLLAWHRHLMDATGHLL